MNKYLKLTFLFIGIWFVASLASGVLTAVTLAIFAKNIDDYAVGAIPASFICSIPFVALCWFISTVACVWGSEGEKLYQTVLHTAFFVSIVAGLFVKTVVKEFMDQMSLLIFMDIVASSVFAVIVFRKKLKSTQ